jgi:translation elongation factor EF-Tu-like GTPase
VTPAIEAELTLLKTEEGGRAAPLRLEPGSPFYMPHLVIGDPKVKSPAGTLLGVAFRRAPLTLSPGDTATVRMDLMYHPQVDYRELRPGATFTVREGPRIVGHGRVIKREDTGAI